MALVEQHLAPLDRPAFSGAMIGHVDYKRTVLIGVRAEIDADAGGIELLGSAVL